MDTEENVPWIEFDIEKIKELQKIYEGVIAFILNNLPATVNWNSPQHIRKYLNAVLDIDIPDAKIKTIANLLPRYDELSHSFEIVSGVLYYLRIKFTLKNYINCILAKEVNGRIYLRNVEGEWRMPNKQPLSYSQEINECIIARQLERNIQ